MGYTKIIIDNETPDITEDVLRTAFETNEWKTVKVINDLTGVTTYVDPRNKMNKPIKSEDDITHYHLTYDWGTKSRCGRDVNNLHYAAVFCDDPGDDIFEYQRYVNVFGEY